MHVNSDLEKFFHLETVREDKTAFSCGGTEQETSVLCFALQCLSVKNFRSAKRTIDIHFSGITLNKGFGLSDQGNGTSDSNGLLHLQCDIG